MRLGILGLWHLGSVTAACMAEAGHDVVAWDPDAATVERFRAGVPAVKEPGLAELVRQGLDNGRLSAMSDLASAVAGADVIWVAFDTPVDDQDRADVDFVITHVEAAMPAIRDGAVVLVSSQLPVGSVRRLEHAWLAAAAGRTASFACSPENLRLGKALDVFRRPDRIVVGVRDDRARAVLTQMFAPLAARIEWMGVESAEMTKHAINAFLATSVTFINEIAAVCEETGADAKDVERGLKTEQRIGPGAYLAPGGAVAGGTLARDIMFLRALGEAVQRPTPLLDGVHAGNIAHRAWAQRRVRAECGDLRGTPIAVWGLTYKPGTDTLRRSSAVELCRWLVGEGANVRVHDPQVDTLPDELRAVVRKATPIDAAAGAAALVVATEWPEYRQVDVDALAAAMPGGLVLDANRFLGKTVGVDSRFRLVSVGQPRQ